MPRLGRIRAAIQRALWAADVTVRGRQAPQFDPVCRDAAKRQFDGVMAWSDGSALKTANLRV